MAKNVLMWPLFFYSESFAARNYPELSAQPVAVPDNFLQRRSPNKKTFHMAKLNPIIFIENADECKIPESQSVERCAHNLLELTNECTIGNLSA